MNEIEDIRARRAAITTANRRVQRYPHLGLDPDTKQPIGERWTVVYAVNDPIWREPHLYIDGLAASRADATFDAAAPADIDTLLAEIDRLQTELARERARADRNEMHGRDLKHETGKLRAEIKRLHSDLQAVRANATGAGQP